MNEYSRIVIENYCFKQPKTKKAKFLGRLVDASYDLSYVPSDDEMILLEEYIEKETNEELKEALIELDDFLCCF